MAKIVTRYLPDGSIRRIWTDHLAAHDRRHGILPVRASNIEPITAGPYAGYFFVDFTLLAQTTGHPEYCVCLPRPFALRQDAVEAEIAWLLDNYILGAP